MRAVLLSTDATAATEAAPWSMVEGALAGARLWWSVTVGASGPHVRPCFAVWVDGRLCTTTEATAVKGRNLAADGRCSFSTTTDGFDLVVEGTATRVTDRAGLEAIQAAYRDKYGWPVEIEGDAFRAPFAAPPVGDGPYLAYAVTPVAVYAFGNADGLHDRSARFDVA